MSHSPYIIPYSFLTVCGAMSRFLSRSNLWLRFPFLPISLLSTPPRIDDRYEQRKKEKERKEAMKQVRVHPPIERWGLGYR